MKKFSFYFLIMVALPSCQDRLTPQDYITWMNKNSATLQVEVKGRSGSGKAHYKPLAWVALREQRVNNDADYQKWMQDWKTWVFLDFDFTPSDELVKELKEKKMLELFLAGSSRESFRIVADGDTLPCAYSHYENSGGLSKGYKFLLGFETSMDKHKSIALLFKPAWEERRTFEYAFDPENINEAPALKFN